MRDYSVVVPVYFNEGSLEYTANKIRDLVFAKRPKSDDEIILRLVEVDGRYRRRESCVL